MERALSLLYYLFTTVSFLFCEFRRRCGSRRCVEEDAGSCYNSHYNYYCKG